MQKVDMKQSVFYERYKPSVIADLVIPEEISEKLAKYVRTQDIPNIGLFSNLPGCLLPGSLIEVKRKVNFVKRSYVLNKYELSKKQYKILKKHCEQTKLSLSIDLINEYDITSSLLAIVKSNSRTLQRLLAGDTKYKSKFLKCSFWVKKLNDIESIRNKLVSLRKYSEYFEASAEYWIDQGFSPNNIDVTLQKIRFKMVYTNFRILQDLNPAIDKNISSGFYTWRGYSLESAKTKISEIQTKNKELFNNKYTKEERAKIQGYGQSINKFLDLGNSMKESVDLLAERQRTFSLKICIEKYGKVNGTILWRERQDKWQRTLKSKTKEEIAEINRRKSTGFNCNKYKPNEPGILYYIRFYNDSTEFWKIGITKDLNKRFRFNSFETNFNLNYDIIFQSEDTIENCFKKEQYILSAFNENRITIDYNNFKSTECFNENVLEGFYNED